MQRECRASYSSASGATTILNNSNPSNTATYDFSPDVAGAAEEYIIIYFNEGSAGSFNIAGGYVQLIKDTSVW